MATTDAVTLESIAAKITEAIKESEWLTKQSVLKGKEAGELLIQAKQQVKHGQWKHWVESNTGISIKTAQGYMKLAKQWSDIESWAQVSGFNLYGSAMHKVLACWKESKCYKHDEMESATLQTDVIKPVFKQASAAEGTLAAVTGRSYPWNNVKPDSPEDKSKDPAGIKLERQFQAKLLLWEAADLLKNAMGKSYLSVQGQQSLEAVIAEVEQGLPLCMK